MNSCENQFHLIFNVVILFDFLKDKDVWREMERDKKSNMVLSQQQVDIVSGDIQFPLF